MDRIIKLLADYKLYLFTFIALSLLTLVSVGLTQIEVASKIAIGIILFIAAIQALILLVFNMHLKYQDKILAIFAGVIFSLIIFLIIITMLDFGNR
jgi:cytochrome c oxidase subunit 4